MRNNIRMSPNGYNYYEDPSRVVTAINQGIDYPVGIDQLERLQKSIEDKYRVEFFLLLARAEREMTAYEIMERQSEKASLMGPQVGALYREGLKKVFDIFSEAEDSFGGFAELPELPPKAESSSINIVLTGPLAQAQSRMFRMQPIKNGINELAQISPIKPEVLDRVNWDEMAEEILESLYFPQHLINSDEEVSNIREERAKAEQQAKAEQMMLEAAKVAPKFQKPVEQNSVMQKLGA
jgi:hypothetical protein